jgi:hypothetical protein
LVDLLVAIAIVLTVSGVAVPQTVTLMQRSRAEAAARYLASRMARARAEAVSRSAAVALQLEQGATDFVIRAYIDGNRNGVRSADIASGADMLMDAPIRLSELFPRVTLSLSPDGASLDPLTVGARTLISFTPNSTATSGTLYIRASDGGQFAVRVLGATARTRLLRYDPRTGAWLDLL